jgi:sugar diacid utilization regulator
MDDPDTVHTPRNQMSRVCGVLALSMMLFDRVEQDEILKLVTSAVPTLGPCRAEGVQLAGDGPGPGGFPPDAAPHPELRSQLKALAGSEGPIKLPATGWAWGYPLRGLGGHCGYLVVSAAARPSPDEQFLVRTLAQQAGAALNSAALYRGERAAAADLSHRTAELASVNQDLTRVVSDLDQRAQTHTALINVAAAGGSEAQIAATLTQLTGMATVVEDTFGNRLSWAGDREPTTYPRTSGCNRTELLNRIRRHGRPLRHRDRVLALAQARGAVLGVLALVDPHHQAGRSDMFALESAAVVLAVELSHQRSLAETELRVRGDLVADLLTGTDDVSAITRSAALGHDLHRPHQVLVISWPGADNIDRLTRVVDQTVIRITQARALLNCRGDKVVLVAPAREGGNTGYDWTELHRLISAALRSTAGAIGVGRLCADPSELPRSFSEASRALRVRQTSTQHGGVTTFESLGFYRVLGSDDSHRAMGEFVREWLGALMDYDETHRCDLLHTLWQYYECGGNYDATARALLIHRSTLRYRLRRIRELTGHDLGVVDTRLNLHIAARAWQIMRAPI